jgi:hypothetical protein
MPVVIEVPAANMAPEHRLAFKPADPAWDHAVVSGEVDFINIAPIAVEGTDDDTLTEYEIHLIVGPWWRDVPYYLTAAGRQLGKGGIKEPGPIKTGP